MATTSSAGAATVHIAHVFEGAERGIITTSESSTRAQTTLTRNRYSVREVVVLWIFLENWLVVVADGSKLIRVLRWTMHHHLTVLHFGLLSGRATAKDDTIIFNLEA